jgi:hypothetical protein
MMASHSCSFVILAATLIAVPASAQLVFYDGTLGDADPVTQGWNLSGISGSPKVTPDAANDLVRIQVENGDNLQVALPTGLSALQAEVSDDAYRWTLDYQIVEFPVIPGVSRHTLGEFNFITGTDSGSAGYRDRLFIEDNRIRFPGGSGSTPFITTDFAFSGHQGGGFTPASVPTWNHKFDPVQLSWNRVGNRSEIYLNNHLVNSGTADQGFGSGTLNMSEITSTQAQINDNSSERVDMNFFKFQVDAPTPLLPAPPASVLYGGAFRGADPAQQGWYTEGSTGTLTITPNAAGEFVNIADPGGGWEFQVKNELTKVIGVVRDDLYSWTVKIAVDEENHGFLQLATVGDNAHRERLFIEGNRIRIVGATGGGTTDPINPADPADVDGFAFDTQIVPGDPRFPNFTSMSDINEISWFRDGPEVFMTINGDLVFRGTGGIQTGGLGDGQIEFKGDADSGTDFDLYSFSLQDPGGGPVPGDYDGSGTVDQLDYEQWKADFGTAAAASDGNTDGIVDAADYTVWSDNFGATGGLPFPFLGLTFPAAGSGSAIGVPEPGTSMLLAVGLILLLARTRKVKYQWLRAEIASDRRPALLDFDRVCL